MLNTTRQYFVALIASGLLLSACAPSSTPQKKQTDLPPHTLTISHAENGLVTQASQHSVSVTIDRLEAAVKAKGLKVFARIDHDENAQALNLDIRPNTLLIFGSPKIGAPLMREAPAIGIDVPVKALAYEDKNGKVFLVYNDPAYLKSRHNIQAATQPLEKMSKALAGLTKTAISP